jgi:hypothetical protein
MTFVLHINRALAGTVATEVDWAAEMAGCRENTSALKPWDSRFCALFHSKAFGYSRGDQNPVTEIPFDYRSCNQSLLQADIQLSLK